MQKDSKARKGLILGIDIGSVSISVVCIDTRGQFMGEAYALHRGDIRGVLNNLLNTYDPKEIIGIASPSGKAHFKESVFVIYHLLLTLLN